MSMHWALHHYVGSIFWRGSLHNYFHTESASPSKPPKPPPPPAATCSSNPQHHYTAVPLFATSTPAVGEMVDRCGEMETF
jgi:hypothetical protein